MPGKQGNGFFADSLARKNIMGVILIHSVISMYHRYMKLICDLQGIQACSKLRLGMYNIRFPFYNFFDIIMKWFKSHSCLGINFYRKRSYIKTVSYTHLTLPTKSI